MMSSWIKVVPAIFIGLGAIELLTISATGNESTHGNEDGNDEEEEYWAIKDLTIAWIERPPYTTSPTNGSLDSEVHGMISFNYKLLKTMLKYVRQISKAGYLSTRVILACVASVSVGLGSKERPKNGILPSRNWGESQNKKQEFFVPEPHGNACYAG